MKNELWIAMGLAAVCAAGVVGYYQNKSKNNQILNQCKAEMQQYGDTFEGLYSASERLLQKQANEAESETLCFRWESRIESAESAEALQEKWFRLKQQNTENYIRIRKWYDFLLSIGVHKLNETEVTVNRLILQQYDLPDETEDCIGKKMQIKTPCWTIENKVLEKGTLM